MNMATPTQNITINTLDTIEENTRTAYSLIDMVRWHIEAEAHLNEIHARRELRNDRAHDRIFDALPPAPGEVEARDVAALLYLACSLVQEARQAAASSFREVTP